MVLSRLDGPLDTGPLPLAGLVYSAQTQTFTHSIFPSSLTGLST